MLLYIKFGNLAWNDHFGGLRYKQSRDEIRSTYAEDSGSVTKKFKLKYYGQPNAFHLIRRGRVITLDVNNENVFKDQNMSEYYPLSAGSMRTVGFENRDARYASSFKISNIYIRKLP